MRKGGKKEQGCAERKSRENIQLQEKWERTERLSGRKLSNKKGKKKADIKTKEERVGVVFGEPNTTQQGRSVITEKT